MENLERIKVTVLRFSSRPAPRRRSADSRRPHRVFRAAARSVDCDTGGGEGRNAECRSQNAELRAEADLLRVLCGFSSRAQWSKAFDRGGRGVREEEPLFCILTSYFCIKWQEWVLITNHTSRPAASCKASRAASVRWTSISTPQLTRAEIIISRLSTEAIRPAIKLRALNPSGLTVAKRMSPARIPTRTREPNSALIMGVSSKT